MMLPRGQSLEAHLEALRPVVALDIQCETCGRQSYIIKGI